MIDVCAMMELAAKHPVEGVALTDVAERLDLSKGTCHRRLQDLVEAGWLEKNPYDRYVVTTHFSALAESIRKGLLAHGDMIARRLAHMDGAQPAS